jgi:hypothetical protein
MELLTSWPSKSRRIVAFAVGMLLREGAAFVVAAVMSAANSRIRESFFIGMVIGWFGIGLGWVGYWIKNGLYDVAGICFLLLFFGLYNKVTLGFIQIVCFRYLFIEIECLYLL